MPFDVPISLKNLFDVVTMFSNYLLQYWTKKLKYSNKVSKTFLCVNVSYLILLFVLVWAKKIGRKEVRTEREGEKN